MENLRHTKLKREIFNSLIYDNWRVTVLLKNGNEYEGGLVGKIESEDGQDVSIILQLDNGRHVEVNLNDIRKIRDPRDQETSKTNKWYEANLSADDKFMRRAVGWVFLGFFILIILLVLWSDYEFGGK